MKQTKQTAKTKWKRYFYKIGYSAAVMLLLCGCSMPGQAQPEHSVPISTVIESSGGELVQQEPVKLQNTVSAENTNAADENPYSIDPEKPMVALTFDDGPSRYTWDIVKSLQENRARATFFLLGNRVINHEAAIDYTLANHNEIASHSFSHQNLTKLSDTEVLNQIRTVDAALLEQHEYVPSLYRVPYGSRDERVLEILKQEGKPVIGWSVDPYDWKVKNKDVIVNTVLERVEDGDIILLHDIYEPTAQAVAELVPALQEKGYQLVTVSELFRFRGVTPEPGVYYREFPPNEDEE